MRPLERVARAHRERLSRCVERLVALARGLYDLPLAAQVAELRHVHRELVAMLLPHLDAVEVTVHPLVTRLPGEDALAVALTAQHAELRGLVALAGDAAERPGGFGDHAGALDLRRTLLRIADLLTAHLAEEERCLAVLETRLTPGQSSALARALDHVVERV